MFAGHKTKIMLLGSNGMLGRSIKRYFAERNEYELVTVARNNADVNIDLSIDDAVYNCFSIIKPEVVINAAAIVNLNLCEGDVENAYRINARLCSVIAMICESMGIYYIQVSTDHYYCGDNKKRHKEGDPIRLLNEYARTKYIGEMLTGLYGDSVILRTNIVGYRGTPYRPTFLEWIEKAICSQEPIKLFDDYYTSSMHTLQLAGVISDIIELRPTGVYNVASAEVFSKREFVLSIAKNVYGKLPNYEVGSVATQTNAQRGDSLGLDTSKIEELVGYSMPTMEEVVNSIKQEKMRNVM